MRPSKRELERAIDDLAGDGGTDVSPDQYVIHRRVVNADGEEIDAQEVTFVI